MGNYTELYVGNLYHSWKNSIPAFLTFMFEAKDYYEVQNRKDPKYPRSIGFSTTCSKALSAMDRNGFTLDFCADVYETFRPELTDLVLGTIEHRLQEMKPKPNVEKDLATCAERMKSISGAQAVLDFRRFLGVIVSRSYVSLAAGRSKQLTLSDGNTYRIDKDRHFVPVARFRGLAMMSFDGLEMYLYGRELQLPPWILAICNLMDDQFMFEYFEVCTLMLLRMSLEIARNSSIVKLDLSDVMDFVDQDTDRKSAVLALHTEMAIDLIKKVKTYNNVFRALFRNESEIRNQYVREQAAVLLERSRRAKVTAERGRELEGLVELLFTANGHAELVDKRVSTGDEEIDIVVKNNIDRPFWNAFSSPLFLVECKNWSTRVGTKELRDFEGKLRNHSALAKVGFFVALNGFTREVASELKRSGREAQHLVLISGSQLEEFTHSSQDFFRWLERHTAAIH